MGVHESKTNAYRLPIETSRFTAGSETRRKSRKAKVDRARGEMYREMTSAGERERTGDAGVAARRRQCSSGLGIGRYVIRLFMVIV